MRTRVRKLSDIAQYADSSPHTERHHAVCGLESDLRDIADLLSSLPTLSTGERRTAAFLRCSLRRIELVDFAIFAACYLPGPKT